MVNFHSTSSTSSSSFHHQHHHKPALIYLRYISLEHIASSEWIVHLDNEIIHKIRKRKPKKNKTFERNFIAKIYKYGLVINR